MEIEGEDIDPPDQPVPAGYERLSDVRDRIGAEELLQRLQLGTITAVELIAKSGERDSLLIDEWMSKYASLMLASGRKYHYFVRERENDDPANPWMSFPLGRTGRLLLVALALNEKAVQQTTRTGKRGASKVPAVVKALRYLYPNGPPPPDRPPIMKAVRDHLGTTTVSDSTLDRARKEAWPSP